MELGLACPVCGQLNMIRATSCSRCGTVLAPAADHPSRPHATESQAAAYPPPPPPAAYPAAPPPPPSSADFQMGRTVLNTSAPPPLPPPPPPRFDPTTGAPMGEAKAVPKTMFFGALQQQSVVPRLVVIKGEGGDGVTYHLSGTTHLVGRTRGDITFGEDVFLSHEHAKFSVQDGRLFVQDVSRTNGVFLRIKRPIALDHGDSFLVGEQLLELDSKPLPEYAPDANGTYFYGSPRTDGAFRVIQQLAGGGSGLVRSSTGNSLAIGREGNELDFPDDRFISGHHARLDLSDDAKVLLTDTGSRNGTFVRIKGAQELFHGDYLFVGQQLFRVEIS
jgi:pSer/pThr/pTyr-binding forkhead associated (FHA) protein